MTPPERTGNRPKDEYEEARRLATELHGARSESRSAPEKLRLLNKVFRELNADCVGNIERLTTLAGELFGATFAAYNRVQGDAIRSICQWSFPYGVARGDEPEEIGCFAGLRSGGDRVTVIRNLQQHLHGITDPLTQSYKLHTFVGCPVRVDGKTVGSLCILFQRDFAPIPVDKVLVRIIAGAVAVEEKRMRAALPAPGDDSVFRLIYGHAPSLIQVVDGAGRLWDANQRWCDVLGYSREEIVGRPALDLLPPGGDRESFVKEILQLKAGETGGRLVSRYVKKDGSIIDVALNCSAMLDAAGRQMTVIAVRDVSRAKFDEAVMQLAKSELTREMEESSDELAKTQELLTQEITRRTQLEEECRANTASFTSIVDNSVDGVFLVDEKGLVLYANRQAATMFGRPRESLIGSQFTLPLEPGNIAEVGVVRPAREAGIAEMRVQSTDWNGIPAFVATLRDITERKQAEDRILRQVALLNAVNRVVREALTCKNVEEVAERCVYLSEELSRIKPDL